MKVRGEDEQSREWDFNRASSTAIAFENREIWALLQRVLIEDQHRTYILGDAGLAKGYKWIGDGPRR